MNKSKIGLITIMLSLFIVGCTQKDSTETIIEPTVSQEQTENFTSDETQEYEELSKETNNSMEALVENKPVVTTTDTIQNIFATHNLKAGVCLSDYMIRDKKCIELITKNFNSITLENHMKPDYILDKTASIESGNLVVKFNPTTEALLAWCKDNGMVMRGHTIIWHSQTPDWIFYENFDTTASLVSREVMISRMESYICQIFERLEEMEYLELFYAYDVVNEAWMEDGSMRESLWLNTIGEDYLWQAFYYADKYAPDYIDLYYNDYNEQFKTNTLYDFVQTLVDEEGNYLIDGIGLQAHLYTEDNLDDYFKTVEKLGSLGLKVSMTELDICLGTWSDIKPATEENLKIQGQYYYNLIHDLLQMIDDGKVKMDSLTFWGFADHLSWRGDRSPLLFDSKFEPKYAYYGALQLKEYAGFDKNP